MALVVAGQAPNPATGGVDADFSLACFNPNGTVDTTFGSGGAVATDFGSGSRGDFPNTLVVPPDVKLVAFRIVLR